VTIEVLRHSIVYLSDSENHALSGIQEFAKQTARQRHCIALKERLLQLLVLLSELLSVVLFQHPHVSDFFLSIVSLEFQSMQTMHVVITDVKPRWWTD
jgi:hypothetical protein